MQSLLASALVQQGFAEQSAEGKIAGIELEAAAKLRFLPAKRQRASERVSVWRDAVGRQGCRIAPRCSINVRDVCRWPHHGGGEIVEAWGVVTGRRIVRRSDRTQLTRHEPTNVLIAPLPVDEYFGRHIARPLVRRQRFRRQRRLGHQVLRALFVERRRIDEKFLHRNNAPDQSGALRADLVARSHQIVHIEQRKFDRALPEHRLDLGVVERDVDRGRPPACVPRLHGFLQRVDVDNGCRSDKFRQLALAQPFQFGSRGGRRFAHPFIGGLPHERWRQLVQQIDLMTQVAALPLGTIRRREVCLVVTLERLSHAGVRERCVSAGWGRVVPVAQRRDEVLVRFRNLGVASAFDSSTSSACDRATGSTHARICLNLSHHDGVERKILLNIECSHLRSILRSILCSSHRSIGRPTIRSRPGLVA